MAQIKTGTVSVISSSPNLSFAGLPDFSAVATGHIFIVTGEVSPYKILSVDDGLKTIILDSPYIGLTQAGLSYSITTTRTSPDGIVFPEKNDIETATLVKLGMLKIQELLSDAGLGLANQGDLHIPGLAVIPDRKKLKSQPYTPPVVNPPVGPVDGKHMPLIGIFSFNSTPSFHVPGAGSYIGEY